MRVGRVDEVGDVRVSAESGRRRRPLIMVAVAGALVLALLITFLVVRHHRASPDRLVEQYLSALEDGDAATLRTLVGPARGGDTTLLLDAEEAAPVDGTVGDVEIVERSESGDGYDYEVEAVQDGGTLTGTLSVQPVAHSERGEARWSLTEATLGRLSVAVPEEAESVRLNGVEFAAEDLSSGDSLIRLSALPGTYTIEAVSPGDYLQTVPETVTLPPTLGDHSAADVQGDPRLEFSPEAQLAVQKEMDALVAKCGDVDDEGLSQCDMRLPDPDAEFGSGRWEFHEQPVAELTYSGHLGGIAAAEGYEEGGGPTATVTYRTDSGDENPGEEQTMDVEYVVAGDVRIDENGELATQLFMEARPAGS
ncbi:hypothetical protein [Brachybacterium sp. AOP3-A1-3]|uniref:hypothetical protein n=1 Tax=Brachybacterium sp. AOP3-A1-3 TaxID=3457699 RepID=UPI004034E8C6